MSFAADEEIQDSSDQDIALVALNTVTQESAGNILSDIYFYLNHINHGSNHTIRFQNVGLSFEELYDDPNNQIL